MNNGDPAISHQNSEYQLILLNQMLTQTHNCFQSLAMVDIDNEENQERPYVDMLLLMQNQVLQVAGVPIAVIVRHRNNKRHIKLENRLTVSCQWVNHQQTRECMITSNLTSNPSRLVRAYGLSLDGGPQAKLIVNEEGPNNQRQELLYVLDEPKARAISHQICERQALHQCMEANNWIIEIGHLLYQCYRNYYVPELDNFRVRYYAEIRLIGEMLALFVRLEKILTHAMVYRPVQFNVQNAPNMPEPTVYPVPALQHHYPNLTDDMMVEVNDINEIQDLQVWQNSIENHPNQLYQIDWHNRFIDFAKPDYSIILGQPGIQNIQFPNRPPIAIEQLVELQFIQLWSNSFVYEGLMEPNLLVMPVNPGAPLDKWVIYRTNHSRNYQLPFYSCGIHGNHPHIGLNGWQSMVLRYNEVDNGTERVFFVTREMAAELRNMFEVWDIMYVYRDWFDDLSGYVSVLLELQRFANGMAENDVRRLQLMDQLLERANWLDITRQQLYDNYLALEKLEQLYRHSVMISNQDYINDPLIVTNFWPALNVNQNFDEPSDDEQFDAPPHVPAYVPAYVPPGVPADVPPDVPPGVPADVPPGVPADVPLDVQIDELLNVPIDIPFDIPMDVPFDLPFDEPFDIPLNELLDVPIDILADQPLDVPIDEAEVLIDDYGEREE